MEKLKTRFYHQQWNRDVNTLAPFPSFPSPTHLNLICCSEIFSSSSTNFHRVTLIQILAPAQDVHFFYTHSHLSALQNCALLLSTNFQFIFTIKNALHNVVIELCSALKYFKNILQIFIKVTHSFVAIELLTCFNNTEFNFYSSRELSVFWLNK